LEGDIKNSSFMAGMSTGNIHEVLSVNKILETIIQEYKQTIRSLNN
jgi:NAD(P)H-dependent flavin oxidoreductase YrpB (nitropropane dioxygenase family)